MPVFRPRPRASAPLRLATLAALLAFVAPAGTSCSGGSSSRGGGAPPVGVPVDDVLLYPFVGSKSVLMIVVSFQDGPALFPTTAEGENKVRAIRDDVVDAYDKDSYGTLSLDIDYTWPPLLIDKKMSDYSPTSALVHVRADAIAAAKKAGYDVDSYDREVLFSPKVWPSGARGWIRTAWMPHTLRWVLVHELGHTLSRGHADFWDGIPNGAGTRVEYGDIFDPMGSGQLWSRRLVSNPWFKLRAGWLDPSDILTVEQTGRYTLTSLENPDPTEGPTAIRIRRDGMSDYWLMYRSTEPLAADGPIIVRATTNPYDPTYLLDMTRGQVANEVEDAALGRGQTFDDAATNGITVTNVSQPGDPFLTLDITVDAARQLALDLPPRIDVLSPPRDAGPVSGVVDFEVASSDLDVDDTNGAGIQKVTMNLFLPSQDPPPVLASQEFLAPPYKMSFDTAAGTTPDNFYYLEVISEGADGGQNQVWFRVIIDNYTGTLP